MPNIFDHEDIGSRDRRFVDNTSQTPDNLSPQPVPSESAKQQINPSPSPAPPVQPKRHVGTKHMHVFTAFCETPDHVSFVTQEDDEKILLLLRRSFITNIPWLLFGVLFAILPFFILGFVPLAQSPLTFVPFQYILVVIAFYYLIIASYIFVNFITWYFNTSLITDKRVVDIDFQDLVYKNIAETKMDLVQDVSETETGVLRTLFNFGDVLVQTAGTLENFNLDAVPHPDRAVEIIDELIGKARDVGV